MVYSKTKTEHKPGKSMARYSTILKTWPDIKGICKKKQMNKPPSMSQIKFSLSGMEGLPVISVKAIELIFFNGYSSIWKQIYS